jgi:hypothetical protein
MRQTAEPGCRELAGVLVIGVPSRSFAPCGRPSLALLPGRSCQHTGLIPQTAPSSPSYGYDKPCTACLRRGADLHTVCPTWGYRSL